MDEVLEELKGNVAFQRRIIPAQEGGPSQDEVIITPRRGTESLKNEPKPADSEPVTPTASQKHTDQPSPDTSAKRRTAGAGGTPVTEDFPTYGGQVVVGSL